MDTLDSWQLISRGSSAEFVRALSREAMAHPAVHHPYLKRLASGDFPSVTTALRDYAFQYSFYGAEFPSYLEGVIGGLLSEKHRNVLRENLEEEKGDPNSDDIDIMPHTKLFGLFRSSLGIDDRYLAEHAPCTTVMVWRDLFLQKCQSRQEGVGLGAIGIATEMVVPTMYDYLLKGIRAHTQLTPRDYHFFELHTECDDKHSQDLIEITVDLADRRDLREAIRFGVFSSLNLRKAFWDIMLSRAVAGQG